MKQAWEEQPQPFQVQATGDVDLLCCHCGGPALSLVGYGVVPFARSLKGRVICQECDTKMKAGEDLPWHEFPHV